MSVQVIRFAPGLKPVLKHAMHDQSTHGNWATGGNGLGIKEVMGLHKPTDPLRTKVYEAEQSFDLKINDDQPKHPVRDDFKSGEDYDKAYKAYSKKWNEWAVNEQRVIFSDKGARLLDGSPSGVKKYVLEVINEGWFVEKFGDGRSLPKLDVKVSNTNAAGRHILSQTKDRFGNIFSERHEISIDRTGTKSERTILHEIAHYATAINETKPFEAHGIEFAKTHLFLVEKLGATERAKTLQKAYESKGVKVNGN